jgi:hypothetical protein
LLLAEYQQVLVEKYWRAQNQLDVTLDSVYILDAAAHTFTTSGFSLLWRLTSDISEFLEQPEFQLICSERDG